ncbi:MAG: dynamin family protein, partial [Candidatus Riflebacteria bacterium]|nr:dynamin family protein [Candidatus Riflebacteria bacterium]
LELFWPSNLLENGVEIIDSPGLNEHETRTKVTSEYLTKADAILFVLNAQAICSQEEMKFIEKSLNSYGFTNPFFIVNRFDAIREREKQRMIDFTHSKLDKYTKQKIYFISALDALDGKEDNDEALLEKSGVPALEKDLADFLTNERGKAKLKQPLNELSYVLQKEAFNKYIPDQRRLLDKDVNQLKKRLEKEKPKLDILREKKNQLSKTMKSRISIASKQLAFLVRGNTKSLGSKVSAWVNECNIDNDIGAFSNEADRKKAAEKILSYVSKKIEKEQREWNNDVLRPEIEKSTKEIFESAESRISEIYSVIDSINIGLTGGNPDTEAVPTWERVAGAVGGLMFGDISTAISGGINGLSKEFFKTFAMNFGLAIGLSMFGILNIFTAIPILAGLIAYNVITGGNKVREQVKKGVSEEIVKQISQQSNEVAENMQKQFEYKFNKQADQIADALDIEINSVEQKVNDIITEKEKGEEAVSKKKALLDRCEKHIRTILGSLQEFNEFVSA